MPVWPPVFKSWLASLDCATKAQLRAYNARMTDSITVDSGINDAGHPLVRLALGENKFVMWRPDEARTFALSILQVAEAAEQDRAMIDVFAVAPALRGQFLGMVREARTSDSAKVKLVDFIKKHT